MSTVLEAERLFKDNQDGQAENVLMGIISQTADTKDEAILREKELALVRLGQYYRDSKNPEGLAAAIRDVDHSSPLNQHPSSSQTQIVITRENVEWARTEKRVFLRQNLEIKLCSLLFEYQQTKEALALIANLLKELKKLDDKMILTEVHLLESRIRHALSDPPKAKVILSSFISARTAANSIYCPPLLQSQLDMQSGVLHAEEKDYKTAYSYFFEALEGLSTQDDPRASLALKCMLMCKVMLNLPEDVSRPGTEAMQAIAKAHENRSLADFEDALKVYKAELSDDPIVRNHLAALYDTLLEQNLIRIIEPYSRIELSYVAEQVKLPLRDVEAKLSQMILDKTFAGILDQGEGCLEIFEEIQNEKMYDYSLDTFKQIGCVVESLYAKAQKLGRFGGPSHEDGARSFRDGAWLILKEIDLAERNLTSGSDLFIYWRDRNAWDDDGKTRRMFDESAARSVRLVTGFQDPSDSSTWNMASEPITRPNDLHPLPDDVTAYFVYPYTLEPSSLRYLNGLSTHPTNWEATLQSTQTYLDERRARKEAERTRIENEKELVRLEVLRLVAPGWNGAMESILKIKIFGLHG
ncbi:hypothetical protein H4Q26_013882 [Puccinia striiformis f. sp. tritici PST-130]|nr:hypothetical protein H4Q26_013882 [Puccinia striiformis f. sp. tritici PST-130]